MAAGLLSGEGEKRARNASISRWGGYMNIYRTVAVALAVVIACISCEWRLPDVMKDTKGRSASPKTVAEFLGSDVIEIISGPDSIESFRTNLQRTNRGETLAGFPIIERGRALSREQIERLKTVLLDEKTYRFGVVKKCLFLPEYGFKIRKGTSEVILLLCFSCEELKIVIGGVERLEDFDNATPQLRRLVDELFTK